MMKHVKAALITTLLGIIVFAVLFLEFYGKHEPKEVTIIDVNEVCYLVLTAPKHYSLSLSRELDALSLELSKNFWDENKLQNVPLLKDNEIYIAIDCHKKTLNELSLTRGTREFLKRDMDIRAVKKSDYNNLYKKSIGKSP